LTQKAIHRDRLEVLKVLDPQLNRVVAVKVLAPDLLTSTQARRRFHREARAFPLPP